MAKKKENAESTVRKIRRKTRKKYNAEDKIRIVIEGLRGEASASLQHTSNQAFRLPSKFFESVDGDIFAR